MISFAKRNSDRPTLSVISTNTRLPPSTHQLGAARSPPCTASSRSISASPWPWRRRRAHCLRCSSAASATPASETAGMISASL